MQYKAVIFDLDGTLYKKRGLKLRMALKDPFHLGLMLSERRARKTLAGRSFQVAAGPASEAIAPAQEALLQEMAKLSAKPYEEVKRWYMHTYMPNMVDILSLHYQADPKVLAFLSELRSQGAKIAVMSDYGFVEDKLEAIGLDSDCFDLITDAASEGGFKPCPQAFLSVAHKLGVDPASILVVGDRESTDGAGARSAGMSFLRVLHFDG